MTFLPWMAALCISSALAVGTPEESYRRAEQLFQEGKLADAGRRLEEIREKHPRHKLYWPAGLLWARCATAPEEAARRFRLLAQKGPAEIKAECEFELAALEVAQGHFAQAEADLERWIDGNRSHGNVESAIFWRGLCLKELGRWEEAQEILEGLKRDGRDPGWRAQAGLLLAQTKFAAGDTAGSRLDFLALAGELWAGDVRPQALLGAALSSRALDREEEGRQLLRRLIGEYPDLPETKRAKDLLSGPDRGKPHHGIQVGAFSSREAAERLGKDYRKQGYPVAIAERQTGSLRLYGVILGPYADRERAAKTRASLREQGVEAFLVEY